MAKEVKPIVSKPKVEDKKKKYLEKEEELLTAEDSDITDESSDSESEEDEDENGELLNPHLDAKILTTLATIKAQDPQIYLKDVSFFDEPVVSEKKEQRPAKPSKMTLKEYQNKQLLDGNMSSEEDIKMKPTRSQAKYASEQEAIKNELKEAFYFDTRAVSDSEDDGIMKTKVKSKDELQKEDEDYRDFLLNNLKSNANAREAMQDWISYSNSNNSNENPTSLSQDDKFLVDYIMNRGWIDKKAEPTNTLKIIRSVEESEEEVERAESFEEQYNFRYEHAQGDAITTHPRAIPESMRRTDSKRQRERSSAKQRKEEERVRQQEKTKRLKSAKRDELVKKAERLVKVSGTEAAKRLLESDSESDFNPDEHDRKMAKIFDGEYYAGNDADYRLEESEGETVAQTRPVKRLLKQTSAALPENVKQAIEDQLSKLDYEDRIDNIACRFKYQPVVKSSYGLDIEDILTADDQYLNRHVSLKKLAPYKSEEQQMSDIKKYSDKRRVWMWRNNQPNGPQKDTK